MEDKNTLLIESYIEKQKRYHKEQDWDSSHGLMIQCCQDYANKRDWRSLHEFFYGVVQVVFQKDQAKLSEIANCQKHLPSCRKSIKEGLQIALEKCKEHDEIKAIYFEYYFDGEDCSEGNFFLCDSYDPVDAGWAAEFLPDDVIEGGSVLDLLLFDEDIEWSNFERHVGNALGFASLLAQLGEVIDEIGEVEFPVGFAEHDGGIIYILPKHSG
jgi:hypothetical protein